MFQDDVEFKKKQQEEKKKLADLAAKAAQKGPLGKLLTPSFSLPTL